MSHRDDLVCLHPRRSAAGIATGAGSASQNSVGTAVFGGMIVSTVLNQFFIPVLNGILKSILERDKPATESAPQT